MYPHDSDFFPWPQMRKYSLNSEGELRKLDKDEVQYVATDRYCHLRKNYNEYTVEMILKNIVDLKNAIRTRINQSIERARLFAPEPGKS